LIEDSSDPYSVGGAAILDVPNGCEGLVRAWRGAIPALELDKD